MPKSTGKYSGLIQSAKTAKQPAETEDPQVSLTIKVPKSLRQYWVAKAKLNGSTLTADITEFLTQKYGKP